MQHHTSLLLAPHESCVVYPTVAGALADDRFMWTGYRHCEYKQQLAIRRLERALLIRPLLPKGSHRTGKVPTETETGR